MTHTHKDEKCKSNQEDNDFQNCAIVDGNCIEYILSHYLGEDHKCNTIIYCAESIKFFKFIFSHFYK